MSTEMIWETLSTGSDETERLGTLLGRLLKGNETIELIADLGGGKTTFVKGLSAGLGSDSMVSSPTFTLNNVYKVENLEIHHYDFYRLDDPGVLKDQLEESLNDQEVVTVVEWSRVVQEVLPKDRLTIRFAPTANNSEHRKISVKYPSSHEEQIERLRMQWAGVKP